MTFQYTTFDVKHPVQLTSKRPPPQFNDPQMRLGSNQILCDKELCALRYWVVEDPWDFIDEEEIWCTLPPIWFGRKLHNVSLYELGCDSE